MLGVRAISLYRSMCWMFGPCVRSNEPVYGRTLHLMFTIWQASNRQSILYHIIMFIRCRIVLMATHLVIHSVFLCTYDDGTGEYNYHNNFSHSLYPSPLYLPHSSPLSVPPSLHTPGATLTSPLPVIDHLTPQFQAICYSSARRPPQPLSERDYWCRDKRRQLLASCCLLPSRPTRERGNASPVAMGDHATFFLLVSPNLATRTPSGSLVMRSTT